MVKRMGSEYCTFALQIKSFPWMLFTYLFVSVCVSVCRTEDNLQELVPSYHGGLEDQTQV